MVISLEDLQQLIKSKADYILIDVREKDELVHGMIPTAHHLPLGEVEAAFDLSDNEFKEKYKFDKPSKTDNLIFHCRSGGRSDMATKYAKSKGYNAKNFKGSIWAWAEIDENVKRYGPEP